jgi:MSHA pilin protein MshA
MNDKKGFTLVELIMIIVILGILAAVAVPKYFNLTTNAQTSAERGVVGGVRSGIQTYFANSQAFPAALDSATVAACTTANACFTNVLSQGGITSDWTKATATRYTGPTGASYTYTAATGVFQ